MSYQTVLNHNATSAKSNPIVFLDDIDLQRVEDNKLFQNTPPKQQIQVIPYRLL